MASTRLSQRIWDDRYGRTGVIMCGLLGGWFLCHTAAIMWDGYRDEKVTADVAVVLGNKVHRNGRPSTKLRNRLDKALALYKEGRVKVVITSGGLGKEGHQEAFVMAQYLRQKGIPAKAVLEDPNGTTTFNTARNTKQMMKREGLSSVVVVSNAYHISRCKLAFRRVGLVRVYGAHARHPDWTEAWSICREFVAYYSYLLRRAPA